MSDDQRIESSPTLDDALLSLDRYIQRRRFDVSHTETIYEIRSRLSKLVKQYNDLMSINEELRLLDKEQFRVEFDAEDDTLTVKWAGPDMKLKINRADPQVPLNLSNLSEGGAWVSGQDEGGEQRTKELEFQMESLLEGYYQNAHRILKLVSQLPGNTNVKAMRTTIVRNKLIEHPKKGSIYSFGRSNNGPRVKPIHRGKQDWNDDGLVVNMMELAEVLSGCFSKD